MSPENLKRIEHAAFITKKAHEGQTRGDGSPYYLHPFAVAEILCSWGADADTIIAGLLHDAVEDTPVTVKIIEREFGKPVAALVEGVTKFTRMDFEGKTSLDDAVETLRRLFNVMRKDIRVIIIKLADRLHNLRTIEGLPEGRRITFAKESLDIYYKIAYHLCMNKICREMTNICVPYVYPEKANIRLRHRKEQKEAAEYAAKEIERELRAGKEGGALVELRFVESSHDLPRINAEDEAADRAYYCIIVAKDTDRCYDIFKKLHALYHPVRRKFHDYIASPAGSGYRSLHTTVIGPHGKPIQLRIRTPEMDAWNRFGVILSAFGRMEAPPDTLAWLHRSAELDRTTRESSDAFWNGLQSDIFQKSIQVMVNGEAVSVPNESTALDAAYLRMGHDAHRIRSITVNGRESDFFALLGEDDVLEVKLGTVPKVRHEWLQFVTTKFARNQIVEALKDFDRSENFALGQSLLQKELDHFQKILVGEVPRHTREEIVRHFNRKNFEEVILMVGEGVISAREVVFATDKNRSVKNLEKQFPFRLRLLVSRKHREEIITQISTLARLHDVWIGSLHVKDEGMDMIVIQLRGTAKNVMRYADFLSALERHSWILKLETEMSPRQKFTLLSSLFSAFFLLGVVGVCTGVFQDWFSLLSPLRLFVVQLFLIAPSIAANFYFLVTLRDYVLMLRSDKWLMIPIILLNVLTCGIFVVQSIFLGAYNNVLPVIAAFVFLTIYIVFRFIVTEELFAEAAKETPKPLSILEWKKLKRVKIIGYSLRLCAVTIWGIQPLYLRYTPANDVDPFVRVFLTGIGVLFVTLICIAVQRVATGRRSPIHLPKNILLFNIVVGYIVFTYLLNASLQFTTSTNFILFNNFSPVLALLAAAMLWRSSIPYLKEREKIFWIFLIFLMGSTGTALIIYNSVKGGGSGSLYGDMLGLAAMCTDTILVISQIRYMKLYKNVSSLSINLVVFVSHILAMLPLMFWYYILGRPEVHGLTLIPVAYGIGAGFLAGIGSIFNYETFRRVDGYIAFLMFNISILITFISEVFFLEKQAFSWMLVLGGLIIIFSTVLAEWINSNCQKRGL
ncbi:hypothetical protein A3C37_04440 [Candidatus Peribacteria bacterium RIFCSPHIGHO2_02_FULL_53_20]|nr:MAG: hypothetical protein A3C37_04440 [Candidatus Peribacteria bacterium RIFCSPHIGHO2_02_FULL_53_20]